MNVILVDFRALDTLGEITVLALAALAAMAVFYSKGKDGEAHDNGRNECQQGIERRGEEVLLQPHDRTTGGDGRRSLFDHVEHLSAPPKRACR